MQTLMRTLSLVILLATSTMAPAAEGDVSIMLSPEAHRFSTQEPDEEFATRIYYQPSERNGTMYYEPVWEPWNTYMTGGPVAGGDFYQMMSLIADPAYVQLYIANGRAEPISIASAEIAVVESQPDLKPIIAINEYEQSPQIDLADLNNYGWGKVENAVAHFNIQPTGSEPMFTDYQTRVDVGSFTTESHIDLKPAMRALGMDPEALMAAAEKSEYQYDPANIERALGLLAHTSVRDEEGVAQSYGLIAGKLEFDWTDALGETRRESVTFNFDHMFFERFGAEMGAADSVSGRFDVELPISGADYVKRFPYKRTVDAGATDRIIIGIKSPRSSLHAFRLRFRLSDGTEVLSPPCQLHFIFPRGLEPDADFQ